MYKSAATLIITDDHFLEMTAADAPLRRVPRRRGHPVACNAPNLSTQNHSEEDQHLTAHHSSSMGVHHLVVNRLVQHGDPTRWLRADHPREDEQPDPQKLWKTGTSPWQDPCFQEGMIQIAVGCLFLDVVYPLNHQQRVKATTLWQTNMEVEHSQVTQVVYPLKLMTFKVPNEFPGQQWRLLHDANGGNPGD